MPSPASRKRTGWWWIPPTASAVGAAFPCAHAPVPLYLYQAERKDDIDGLNSRNIGDCIECGSCAYICPARIPLVQSFKNAKAKVRAAASKN